MDTIFNRDVDDDSDKKFIYERSVKSIHFDQETGGQNEDSIELAYFYLFDVARLMYESTISIPHQSGYITHCCSATVFQASA